MLRFVVPYALAWPVLAAAQLGNSAGMDPSTPDSGVPAPAQANTQDRLFVHLLGSGGVAEIEAAKLAATKASSGPVRDFARQMLRDHGPANESLATLAKQAGVPLPTRVDPDHAAMRSALEGANGAAFDQAYVRGQIVDHQKTVQILEWEIAMGQAAQLQRYAAATLPVVLQHLQMLQQLSAQMTGAPPQGLGAQVAAGGNGRSNAGVRTSAGT